MNRHTNDTPPYDGYVNRLRFSKVVELFHISALRSSPLISTYVSTSQSHLVARLDLRNISADLSDRTNERKESSGTPLGVYSTLEIVHHAVHVLRSECAGGTSGTANRAGDEPGQTRCGKPRRPGMREKAKHEVGRMCEQTARQKTRQPE